MYILKFSGIPLECHQCKKDPLHHQSYHLKYHDNCKFCVQNRYKLKAQTEWELEDAKKKQSEYYRSVCPHCDKKFCEPYSRKKHVELEHQHVPYKCELCGKTFQSKQSKEYHKLVQHSVKELSETCDTCGKKFPAKVSLRNHQKYAHSDLKNHSCPICNVKFKQKKNRDPHIRNLHGINPNKEESTEERHQCESCDSSFKYRGDLNAHKRLKHQENGDKKSVFECDQCNLSYTQKKHLTFHKKTKHK